MEIKKLLDDEDLENIYVDEQKTDHTDLKSFREMYSEKSKKFKVYKYTPKLFELISSAEPKMEAELDA